MICSSKPPCRSRRNSSPWPLYYKQLCNLVMLVSSWGIQLELCTFSIAVPTPDMNEDFALRKHCGVVVRISCIPWGHHDHTHVA